MIRFPYFTPSQVKAAESISNILRHNIKPGVAYQVKMVMTRRVRKSMMRIRRMMRRSEDEDIWL